MKTNSLDFDAQALRDKILDLAMRGKLVPQDPDDEPASVLLEKIKAEKAELIKEKKIKKSKPLPLITDDEKPFDIPDSWEWVRLGDVIDISSGSQLRRNDMIENGEYSVFGANGKIGNYDDFNIPEKTILIGRVGSVGSINITKNNTWATDNALIVKEFDKNNLYYKWLEFILKGSKLSNLASRTSQPVISATKVKNVFISFPPLSEQKRIAAKISQLFALLRKVESSTQQYAKLQTLLKSKVLDLAMRGKLVKQDPNDEPASVLLEKIKAEKQKLIEEKKIKKTKPLPPITDDEKPFDIPDSWEWVRLEDIAKIGDIDHKMPKQTIDGIYPYISPKDFVKDGINYDNSKKISKEDFELLSKKFLPQTHDLIFPRYGTIGKIREINVNFPLLVSYSCCLIRPNHLINNNFVKYELRSCVTKREINRYINKSTQPNVGLRSIKRFLFPLPPLSEQSRIVDQILNLNKIIGE